MKFVSFIAGIMLMLAGCATNPVTGKKEISLLSTEAEIAMGEQHYLTSQQSGGGQYTVDPKLAQYVASVGNKIAAVSDRELPYEFVVLNDGTPNAWALPGGKIAINRGLLIELENEAEMAAVLAHEIVHAAAKHGAKAWQRGLLFEMVQIAVAVATQDSDDADYAIGGASVALGLTGQKYSRDAERSADYYGMKYMRAAGYDSAAAVTLQEKFVALSNNKNPNWLEGLFATHPPSAGRVNNNRAALDEFPSGGILGRARYQNATAHLRKTKSAYDKADNARHLMQSDANAALRAINNAISKVPNEPSFYSIKGHILAHKNNYPSALRAYDQAIAAAGRHPHYEMLLGRGAAYNKLGRNYNAKNDLTRSNKLFPTATAAYLLGDIALSEGSRSAAKQLYESAAAGKGDIGNAARAAFIKLDIADAPWRYINTEISFGYDEVIVKVTNTSRITLRDVVVEVQADINQRTVSRRQTISQLGGRAAIEVRSGIRYRDEDEVTAGAKVIQARTSE